METFVQLLVSGISSGLIYGSIALAIVFIFQSTHTVNFAQGEMATLGTFVAWGLLEAGMPYALVAATVIGGSMLVGVMTHRLLIRPVEGKSPLAVIIVVLALFTLINGLTIYIWGGDIKVFDSPFRQEPYEVAGIFFSAHEIGTALVLIGTVFLMFLLFERTNFGLTMRATAENRISSELLGIRTDWMLALGWGFAAAIGTIAGMLVAPVLFLEPAMMASVLLYALAAVTLGGFGSPAGALIGGIAVGIFENMLGQYVDFVGTDLKLPATLVLIMIILLIKPQGLFGKPEVVRV